MYLPNRKKTRILWLSTSFSTLKKAVIPAQYAYIYIISASEAGVKSHPEVLNPR
jgi:hypothetical protein